MDRFEHRHIGPNAFNIKQMCQTVGVDDLQELVKKTVPDSITIQRPTRLGKALTETETLNRIREIGSKNKVFKSYLGMGYYSSITPPVILRNVMENPGWYTQVLLLLWTVYSIST
jgi:glycine dehydrogenase